MKNCLTDRLESSESYSENSWGRQTLCIRKDLSNRWF